MKRFLLAFYSGALLTAILVAALVREWSALDRVLLWPIAVFMYLVGPGPTFSSGGHEWTPIHALAYLLGIGTTWLFYSGLIYGALRLCSKRPGAEASP